MKKILILLCMIGFANAGQITERIYITPTANGKWQSANVVITAPRAGQMVVSNSISCGQAGFETTGVSVSGNTIVGGIYVNDTNNQFDYSIINHEHSTTKNSGTFLSVRANTDSASHGDVVAGMDLGTWDSAGWISNNYKKAAYIKMSVDSNGIITFNASQQSMPGKISFGTSPSGSMLGVERMSINSFGAVNFAPLSVTPSTATAGDTFYHLGQNKIKTYNGSSWFDLF